MTTNINQPIIAGRCLLNIETMDATPTPRHRPYAGVRISQPSSGGDDCHYVPASDCYLHLTLKDAQALSALFSGIARTLQGVEA